MAPYALLDMPRKQHTSEGWAYTGLGKRFEAGLKSLLARADLDLDVIDVNHLIENHDEWMIVEIQIGEPLDVIKEDTYQRRYRLAGARFTTALCLHPTGRVDCQSSALNFGEMWVASSNSERVDTDPFSVFRLDAHTIWQLSERIWVQLAWQLLKLKADA